MRKVAGHPLWIGHAGDLLDPRAILNEGIEAIVELADSEPFATLPRGLIRCRFPISDGGENPDWLLRLAIDTIAELVRIEIPTLVACSAGMSRSVILTAAGLAMVRREEFIESLALMSIDGPIDLSPALVSQVADLPSSIRGDSGKAFPPL